jgi:hypothetical protein
MSALRTGRRGGDMTREGQPVKGTGNAIRDVSFVNRKKRERK